MSIFQFLHTDWPSNYTKMKKAEERVNSEPVSTASYCRLVLEECIYIVSKQGYTDFHYNKDLTNLMSQEKINNSRRQCAYKGGFVMNSYDRNSRIILTYK